ncbi:MAG: type II toxin-antitoxin system VapC family toxin [Gammaproteobacteria bacterium]|nr:MAG: type II toxin-antitoxin system VapC family toxin [Gammaproteobacteria bacterium]
MRLLLDTHALIWWLVDDPALPRAARDAIASPENDVYVSHVSAWEIAVKQQLGKIEFPLQEFENILDANQFEPLPIRLDHILTLGTLPLHHRDPFDRLLVAQSGNDNLILVSGDRHMTAYGVRVLWDS